MPAPQPPMDIMGRGAPRDSIRLAAPGLRRLLSRPCGTVGCWEKYASFTPSYAFSVCTRPVRVDSTIHCVSPIRVF